MCVTCLFGVRDFLLLSTKHADLRTSYNIVIAPHKHTIQSKQNQTRQAIEKCWFNILDLLRYCDKRDMTKRFVVCKIWIWEFGWQYQKIWKEWTWKVISEESLCFTKAWIELGMVLVNWITQVSKENATTILLNKCDNNYSEIVCITLRIGYGFVKPWITQLTHLQIE
jgi:hypothetical protein